MAHSAELPRARRQISRRDVLLSGMGLIAAAGLGGGLTFLRPLHKARPDAPAALVAALAAERQLIARIDASATRDSALRAPLSGIRADHRAHVQALEAAAAQYAAIPPAASSTVAPGTRAQLRSAEQAASTAAAQRAADIGGRLSPLLASIAASEASHAEVLR